MRHGCVVGALRAAAAAAGGGWGTCGEGDDDVIDLDGPARSCLSAEAAAANAAAGLAEQLETALEASVAAAAAVPGILEGGYLLR